MPDPTPETTHWLVEVAKYVATAAGAYGAAQGHQRLRERKADKTEDAPKGGGDWQEAIDRLRDEFVKKVALCHARVDEVGKELSDVAARVKSSVDRGNGQDKRLDELEKARLAEARENGEIAATLKLVLVAIERLERTVGSGPNTSGPHRQP